MYETQVSNLLKESEQKMQAAVEAIKKQFGTVRTGRAHPGLVENIKVDYYGSMTPLNQVANISTPEPRLIAIQPWDKNTLGAVEKAILASDVGLTPNNDGKVIRLSMPQLTNERRQELVKVLHRMAEEGKVSIRNTRHEAIDKAEKYEKANEMTEDDKFLAKEKVQEITEKYTDMIKELLQKKEEELQK